MIRGYRKLPEVVKGALLTSEGWLVGSAADDVALDVEHKGDYDIAVPDYDKYFATVKLLTGSLSASYSINSFGGIKINLVQLGEPIIIDIWPQDLNRFVQVSKSNRMYHLKTNTLIQVERC